MILLATFPAVIAFAIFFGTLRQRGTSKAEREATAAASREFRMLAGRALLVLFVFGAPLGAIAFVHHYAEDDFRPLELR